MSDKPDWAEELAAAIIPVWSEAIDYREPIAAALRKMIADKESEFLQRERKAKADGVHEASDWIWDNKEQCGWSSWINLGLNKLANEIENGEP